MCGYFCIGFIDFMFAGKTLVDFNSFFLLMILKKMTIESWVFLRMVEVSSNLSDQTKFKLSEINKIKVNFTTEVQERKIMSRKLSKYIAAFNYIDKILIVLSATIRVVSIISFASVIGAPAEIARASFTLVFSLNAGIIKKVLQITRNT